MNSHLLYPLRRIVKRETQNGRSVLLLICNHAVPGVPASRQSRFYPCSTCHKAVVAARKAHRKF